MAGHRQFQSAAKGRAMNGHHHWSWHIFDLKQERKQACASLRLAGCDLAEFLYVRAGDERTAATNQHHSLDAIVMAHLRNSLCNRLRDPGAQSVHWRVIDGDNCDISIFSKLN